MDGLVERAEDDKVGLEDVVDVGGVAIENLHTLINVGADVPNIDSKDCRFKNESCAGQRYDRYVPTPDIVSLNRYGNKS